MEFLFAFALLLGICIAFICVEFAVVWLFLTPVEWIQDWLERRRKSTSR